MAPTQPSCLSKKHLFLLLILMSFSLPLVAEESEYSKGTLGGFNPNYVLIGVDSIESNEGAGRGDCDIKFQLSFSSKLRPPRDFQGGNLEAILEKKIPLYFGYTQESYWDICRKSSPFRETNYRPTFFARYDSKDSNLTSFYGYEHESNGRDNSDKFDVDGDGLLEIDGVEKIDGNRSRGWDRIYARWRLNAGNEVSDIDYVTSDRERFVVDFAVWYPFSISSNNRNITKYSGYGELGLTYTINSRVRTRLTIRKGGGFKDWDRGLSELELITPVRWTRLKLYFQYLNGYGASLERYNQHENALRIGFLFSDFNLF